MMKEVILLLTVLVMFIVCFFVMGKIGYFINEILQDKIENIFNDINQAIFNEEHVDLQHIYIDGSKFEANANKYISQLLA